MTDTTFYFILLSLASYRLARLLVDEQAPFGIAEFIRNLFGASDLACIEQRKAGRITNALCCYHCIGVYTSILWVTVYSVAFTPLAPVEWVLWVAAVSGAVSWLFDR